MKPEFPNASESFRKRNPHLFGVGSMEAEITKPTPVPSLVGSPPKRKAGKNRVECRVTLVVAGKRQLDDDNLSGACKPLRDAIARDLGIDDGDKRCQWEYGQFKTSGEEGVMVKITV